MEESKLGFIDAVTIGGITFTAMDTLIIGVSLILLLLASPICRWLSTDDNLTARISMMRVLNFLIIFAVLFNVLVLGDRSAWVTKLTQCLMVIYFAVFITQIVNYFVRRRFGKFRVNKDKTTISDTYSSRGLSLIVAVMMGVIAIISCLQILGLETLLEAGGALGIIGLILALTQAAWAPDIISGLIILNSRFCEDGDVIQFNMDGREVNASVFKTKLFHTECLDLTNNHRIMIRNARLRDYGIQNLSRFASARGLREVLFFNIDYAHSEDVVKQMIERAFAEIDSSETAREEQYEPEIRVHDTGDYAVTWAVYYYIKDVKKLLSIRQLFRAYILAESKRSNISLATPSLQNNIVTVDK
jgi:small-conductance mechanosensitive channel